MAVGVLVCSAFGYWCDVVGDGGVAGASGVAELAGPVVAVEDVSAHVGWEGAAGAGPGAGASGGHRRVMPVRLSTASQRAPQVGQVVRAWWM